MPKLVKMSDFNFRLMSLVMRTMDFFYNPTQKLAKLNIPQGATVIDFACGPGRYTTYLAQQVGPEGQVYAIDIHPLAIEAVKAKTSGASGQNIETILVEGYETGLPEDTVDWIIFLDAFFMVPEKKVLLKALHRLLKPGGQLFLEPGHMNFAEAGKIVQASELFELKNSWKREYLFAAKK